MSEDTVTPDVPLLDSLCVQARALVTTLPGALSRVTITVGDHRVEVEWHAGAGAPPHAVVAAPGPHPPVATSEADATPIGHAVVAPLLGTFYRSAEPGTAPFVTEGDIVEAGQQIAIVEAMKLMNPVESDRAGKVVKILPADGEMVEFGQELMLIEPADAEPADVQP